MAVTHRPFTSALVASEDDLLGADVVDALRQGERWAWERVYGTYARRLTTYLAFRLGGPDAAADALSETLARALNTCSRLRVGRQNLSVWLFRIARAVADEAASAGATPSPRTTSAISAADEEVLVLRLCARLNCAEVARVVGRRAGAVRAQQLRALEMLASGPDPS